MFFINSIPSPMIYKVPMILYEVTGTLHVMVDEPNNVAWNSTVNWHNIISKKD